MGQAQAKANTGPRKLPYVSAITEAVREVLLEQDTAFVAGEDVGQAGSVYGYYRGLFAEFGGDRVIDTPISEKGIIGLGVGAAATGLRPIVDIMFMDFLGECMDEVANQMAKMRFMFGGSATLPITVLTMAGAGANLAAQHSQSLEAWLAHLPGLKVVMPATPYDVKGLHHRGRARRQSGVRRHEQDVARVNGRSAGRCVRSADRRGERRTSRQGLHHRYPRPDVA